MEFKFRAIDEQASTYLHSSSSMSYFTEQALRAGYRSSDFGRANEFFQNPSDVREAVQRELEKERIREEIIAEEIARKRLLEAEVRREMLMEREMALRRGDEFSFLSVAPASSSIWFEPRLSILHRSEGRLLEERLALSLEERLSYSTGRENREVETLPFQRKVEPKISEIKPLSEVRLETLPFQRKVEPRISEIKPLSEVRLETLPFQRKVEPRISEIKPLSEVSKEKIIFLAKPDGNLSGAKRKAETPPAAGACDLPSVGSKKKPKEEWSCALCQVSATNEQGLNEHLQGKKHKAREAGLIAQRTGKNFTIGLFPKKTSKPTKLVEMSEKKSNTEGIKSKLLLQHRDADDSKKKKGEAVQKMQKNRDFKKKRFKFWCEMCQIGAYSEKVMETHRKGKKHVGRLQELDQNGESVPSARMAETTRNVKDAELVAKVEKKETSENVGVVEAGTRLAAVGVAAACGTS